jgi:dTDP-4-dehydrorhamnose 3,5-epimerase
MQFEPTRLPEVILIKPRVFGDARGAFFETWQRDEFARAGITATFVQDNHSRSTLHTLRGLHYQIQQAQGKLVRVTRGEVFDVAVDIRRSSPRYGQWAGVILSEENHHMLWVPKGFAHGYLSLSERADFVYKCTDFYAPQDERGIHWNDPQIDVRWPLPAGIQPVLSSKDQAAPLLQTAEVYP